MRVFSSTRISFKFSLCYCVLTHSGLAYTHAIHLLDFFLCLLGVLLCFRIYVCVCLCVCVCVCPAQTPQPRPPPPPTRPAPSPPPVPARSDRHVRVGRQRGVGLLPAGHAVHRRHVGGVSAGWSGGQTLTGEASGISYGRLAPKNSRICAILTHFHTRTHNLFSYCCVSTKL